MVHYSKVIRGITKYIEDDILSKLSGTAGKWAAGVAVALAAKRAEQMYQAVANNAVVRALGFVEGENVDVDAIYAELMQQAKQGDAVINVPMLGQITFSAADVESLYRHILGA